MSIYDYRPLLVFSVIVAAYLGAVMGSFLNCVAWRVVHGEPFVRGRSHCPHCNHVLGPLELIPVFSWLIQRGRCKACGEKISVRYPLTEFIFAVATVLCLLRFDLTVLCLRNWVFLGCLFVLTLTDLDAMIIPDGCHIVALAAWLAALPFVGMGRREIITHLIAGVALGGGLLLISLAMDKIMGRDTLGGGDIKLLAVVGLYLGPIGALFALVLACVIGLLLHGLSRGESARPFPFGPSLAVAAAGMLLFGAPLVAWYRGLLA